MSFITNNTGGGASPYQFNTTGMTYGPSPTADRAQCASAECAAGLAGSQGRGFLPDYLAINPSVHTIGLSGAVNLYDGTTFGGGSVNITNSIPGYRPSSAMVGGYILGVNSAAGTSDFLGGQGTQGGVSLPMLGRLNIILGFNHSYGGATAIELGVAPPSSISGYYSPWGYSNQINK